MNYVYFTEYGVFSSSLDYLRFIVISALIFSSFGG